MSKVRREQLIFLITNDESEVHICGTNDVWFRLPRKDLTLHERFERLMIDLGIAHNVVLVSEKPNQSLLVDYNSRKDGKGKADLFKIIGADWWDNVNNFYCPYADGPYYNPADL